MHTRSLTLGLLLGIVVSSFASCNQTSCQAGGDAAAFCVFGDHCSCSEGFLCGVDDMYRSNAEPECKSLDTKGSPVICVPQNPDCPPGEAINALSKECVAVCGALNEVYKACYSSSCKEPTCVGNVFSVPGPQCTSDCQKGCVCDQGFGRNTAGACVSQAGCQAGTQDVGAVGIADFARPLPQLAAATAFVASVLA